MPSPRCALPIMSERLSSSGMAIAKSSESFRLAPGPSSLCRDLFDPLGDFHDSLRQAGFFFDRSHGDVRNAAGNDLIEGREIAPNLERESVHRDPMANTDTDRRDLAILHPDASQTTTRRRRYANPGQRLDEQIFEPAQISMQILAAVSQIDDWIADQLARAVVGCLAAAINGKQWMRKMLCTAQTRLVGRATDRVNWIVFEQKELVA